MIEPVLKDDAFLADVHLWQVDATSRLFIWWLGQSGFLVQHRRQHLLFDPYLSDSLTKKYAETDKPHVRMTARVIEPHRLANLIACVTSTHNHTDHLDAETLLPLARSNPSLTLVHAAANETFVRSRLGDGAPTMIGLSSGQSTTVSVFEIVGVPAAHDRLEKDGQGRDVFMGFIVRAGPWTLYHSGDTVIYEGMAELLRRYAVDVAFLPINGKVGNMNGRDAARLAHDIGAKLVVPCHYEMFEFNTASPYELFVPECERLGQPYKVLRAGERLTLTK